MSVPALKLKDLPQDKREQLADDVLVAYDQGEEIAERAEKLGVSPNSLYRLLNVERLEEWRAAQAAKTEAALAEAVKMMREAKDHLQLAKGEKLAARFSWKLERLSPKLYGPRQEPERTTAVQININLRGKDETESKVVAEVPAEETPKLAKAA